MLATEVGWRGGPQRQVEVGGAGGIGQLAIGYSNNCDGVCTVGGGPVMLSPVARVWLVDEDRFAIGAFARVVVGIGLRASELDEFGASWMIGACVQGP